MLPIAVLGADDPADLTHERGTALLDTGATSSAITARFIDRLGLLSIGKRRVMVATEQRFIDFYVFRLGLFSVEQTADGGTAWPHVFAETEGFEIKQSDNFDVLLGLRLIHVQNAMVAARAAAERKFAASLS